MTISERRARTRAAVKKLRARRAEQGLCVACGQPSDTYSHAECQRRPEREHVNAYMRKYLPAWRKARRLKKT